MTKNKQYPLMPKATAVWLINNTKLTFAQIADFCGLHYLEVKGIADNEVAVGIMGIDPITSGQITIEELERCSLEPSNILQLKADITHPILSKKKKRGTKYTPIARRQDKPDAILWLIKNFPEITDSSIIKLIGTTKTTISAIRDSSHWNMSNIRQRDPVLLGLCTQIDLDQLVTQYNLKTREELLKQQSDNKQT